jgi:acyl carrier protein
MDQFDDEVMSKLHDVLIEVVNLHRDEPLEPANVTAEADFYEELGMDSLMAVALVIELQRTFKRRIPEAEVPALRNLRTMHAFLVLQLAS